ncbi:IS481-like element ISKrh2 family transposase [Kocuria rhizophila]|uniref:Putative transposase n=1 Tax=Kocuria rhizophila (strain ATCC 9341 / DSM 348 / NBRC 103217 / DC2201) TaxID=378753 RepID=B2GJY0_KOCRD|nr:IS481-like element ISKrh2 family transposase [Kocuria rhizophila]ASE10958.1 IS481-like element ISKrh2 family transposase [Kocuria rhizophila]BAG29085.1 putative transposase [Kocuria rhizophila DC2201]VEH75630.1 Transposase and inactivated derivatives [Kocuria rhizophila]
MTHANAPLTPTGRLRMVLRHLDEGVPQAHVAAEFRVSRPTVATWVTRYRAEGEAGLHDRTSRPRFRPSQLNPEIIAEIESLRRDRKWSARRIHHHLLGLGYQLHLRTVGRWLRRLGISRLRDLTPDGENLRRAHQRIRARWAGHMLHLDVKKLGRIPDGGGWWAHGRGSMDAKAAKRGPGAGVGYTYLHSAVDGFSRLAYTEALADEKAATTIAFFARARAFFAAHGITRIHRVITDNGANYRAKDFTRTVEALANRHQRIRPYTPRHNGKVERYNRLLADEVLYARPYPNEQARRDAIGMWVNHFNYHRPHTACGDQPPASRTPARVNNVTPSYI